MNVDLTMLVNNLMISLHSLSKLSPCSGLIYEVSIDNSIQYSLSLASFKAMFIFEPKSGRDWPLKASFTLATNTGSASKKLPGQIKFMFLFTKISAQSDAFHSERFTLHRNDIILYWPHNYELKIMNYELSSKFFWHFGFASQVFDYLGEAFAALFRIE